MNAHARNKPIGPAEPDMERIVVGAVLNSDSTYWRICNKIRPAHFSMPILSTIWKAIDDLAQEGRGFPPLMIRNRIGEEIDGVQIKPFLHTLSADAEDAQAVDDYVDTVVSAYQRRRLIELAGKLANASQDVSCEPMTIIGDSLEELTEVAGFATDGEASFADLYKEVMEDAVAAREGRSNNAGFTTGIGVLDNYIGPVMRDQLIEIGAQSNIGKTILAMQIAEYVSAYRSDEDPGVPVLFFAIDEGARQIVARRVASWSGIGADAVDLGHFDDFGYEALREGHARAEKHKLHFSSGGGRRMTFKDIRARALSFKRSHGCGLVLIDHFKAIAPPKMGMNPIEAAPVHAWGLKALKDELGCPVIFLNQVLRSAIAREDQRPRRNDLWGGGDVTEVPDTILLVHRPDQLPGWKERRRNEQRDADYDGRIAHEAGLAEIIIDKARRRKRGHVNLTFDERAIEFRDRREGDGAQAMLGEW